MALNYANFQGLAKRLIDENGREIVLVKSLATAANPAKPWLGSSAPHTGTGAEEVTATGIFLDYDEKDIDETMIKRGDQRCLVAETDLSPATDISDFDAVKDVDADVTWRIVKVSTIQPGDTRILYDLQLRQ